MHKMFLLFFFSLVSCFLSSFSIAAGFVITPMSLSLSVQKSIAPLSLINNTEETLVVHTELFDWQRALNKDSSTPTHEAIVSPPIAIVAPHTTQVFRVGLWQAESSVKEKERYFHLYLIPVGAQSKVLNKSLKIQMRLGIPVYLAPTKPVAQIVTKQISSKKKNVVVTLGNTGNAHAKIINLSVVAKGSKKVLGNKNINENIFPGESKQWEVALNNGSTTGYDIKVLTDPSV